MLIYIHSFTSIIKATEKLKQQPGNFPGDGSICSAEMDLYGAFEQLFGPGRRDLNKNIPKIQMPGGMMLKLRFDWYIMWANHIDANEVKPNDYFG